MHRTGCNICGSRRFPYFREFSLKTGKHINTIRKIIINMENILGTKSSIKIISSLLSNPLRYFKESELLKESGTGKGSGAEAVDRLESAGIIRIKRAGKMKFIRLNNRNPVAFALRQLFDQRRFLSLPDSKVSAISLFREKIRGRSEAIILPGSPETGNKKSGTDLLVVTDDKYAADRARKETLELSGENINIHLIKPGDLLEESGADDHVRNALESGIIIQGGEFVRETLISHGEYRELKLLKGMIHDASEAYDDGDDESAVELVLKASEAIASLACELEGIRAFSGNDALLKIKKIDDYRELGRMHRLNTGDALDVLDNLYRKLSNRIILKAEGILR